MLADGVKGLNAAPVELHRAAYPVSTRAQHYDGALVTLKSDVTVSAGVSNVKIVCLGGILCRQRVNLLHHGQYAVSLAQTAYCEACLSHVAKLCFKADGTGYLEIAEAVDLGRAQQFLVEHVYALAALKFLIDVDDVLQLVKEPLVYLRKLVYLVYGVVAVHGLRDDEDAVVRRVAQSLVNVGYLEFLVLNEAVHALPYHAQTLLYGLLEVAADGHHLAHRLHRRAQLTVYSAELAEVPARNLAHYVVESRLEEGTGGLGYRVFQLEQAVSQAKLGGHEGQRIARGF